MPDLNTPEPVLYFGRELDYLEDLGAKLRNLKGFSTLAHELLQNADDVPGVDTFIFNICDDALIIENNGKFSDCNHPEEKECPWKSAKEHGLHRCDFHRFRIVAGADKRNQAEATGAFGIGFISVYQITDRPELISSGRHWIIDESQSADKRIAQCNGCTRCRIPNLGTRFFLPWALDPNSALRLGFRTEVVSVETPNAFLCELEAKLPMAMLFLKRINTVEIQSNGKLVRRLERVIQDNSIILNMGDSSPDMVWYLLRGNFDEVAETLRVNHPNRIEAKRSAVVTIAIPESEFKSGLLCATLPTQERTGLPFHVNADFFPSEDRKRIILEQDFQSQWNRAALVAAAKALADSYFCLRDALGHKRFWSLLSRLYQVSQEVTEKSNEPIYGQFWTRIASSLAVLPVIYTHNNEWRQPSEVFYLQQKNESSALPVLNDMGLSCLHEDLRPYQNLLISKEIGVRSLGFDHLVQLLRKAGLTRVFPKNQWPDFLQRTGALRLLLDEVEILWLRRIQGSHQYHMVGSTTAFAAELSLAIDRDGALCPCNSVYRAPNEATEQMFLQLDSKLSFTSAETNKFDMLQSLCPMFGAAQAIGVLQRLGFDGFTRAIKAGHITVSGLLSWFVDYRTQILGDPALKKILVKLPIFPSAGGFQPLTTLSLPGNFSDHLQLAAILDVNALPNHHDFLRELGIEELSFPVYVSQHLIPALKRADLPVEKRRAAALLLATRRSEIGEEEDIRGDLSNLPVIECVDRQFRVANHVYFHNPIVVEVLGTSVPQAIVPIEHAILFTELLSWLGVVDNPRVEDIVARVKSLVMSPPNASSIASVRIIFNHLTTRFLPNSSNEELGDLRTLAWLPVRNRSARWFKPVEVYAAFQDYLFISQVDFIDIDRTAQTNGASFLGYLGIKTTPHVSQVVAHLLNCAETSSPVNQEVYSFLNNKANAPEILQLRNRPCLRLPAGQYVSPNDVFWSEHHFGRFRHQLGPELRKYNDLFQNLGVRENPTYKDALQVLTELAEQFGACNRTLDDSARSVCLACWQMLATALENKTLTPSVLASLADVKCIPNAQHNLTPPSWLFFEDRAGLAAKFQGFLTGNTISRPMGTAKAMAVAGVHTLAEVVDVLLLERRNPIEDVSLSQRVQERRLQFARVFNAQSGLGKPAENLIQLDGLRFESVEQLRIAYRLKAFGQTLESSAEDCPALYRNSERVIIFVQQNGRMPWSAIARELALALCPDEEPGRIAPGIKEVLAAGTVEEAKMALDELGFTILETPLALPPSTETITTLGGDATTQTDPPPTVPAPIEPQFGGAQPTATGGSAPTNGTTTTPSSPSSQSQPPSRTPPTGSGGSTGTNAGTTTGGANTSGGGRAIPRGPRRGKLRSYVVKDPTPSDEPPDTEGQERRHAVNEAGIAKVEAFERSLGCAPRVMPHTHPGYDIESYDPNGAILRYIEVKSRSGDWGGDGVGLTKTEFLRAQELGDLYWLYIVERAESADFHIHCIQNPAGKVDQFFYDDSWQPVEETDRTKMRPPEDW